MPEEKNRAEKKKFWQRLFPKKKKGRCCNINIVEVEEEQKEQEKNKVGLSPK